MTSYTNAQQPWSTKVIYVLFISLFFNVSAQAKISQSEVLTNAPMGSNSEKATELSYSAFTVFHQCEKNFQYEVFFLQKQVGYISRKETWSKEYNDENIPMIKAEVETSSRVRFLFLKSTYHQQSFMHYLAEKNLFLTSSFNQKLTGIKKRDMAAEISADGMSSIVMLDDEVSQYNTEDYPLYDLDTLGAQMRLNLIQNKKQFTLHRQGSDKVKVYHFKVVGVEVINHKYWGDLNAIKIIEVGDHEGTELWFSMKHDYQLVKAKLDLIFAPIVWLTKFEVQC